VKNRGFPEARDDRIAEKRYYSMGDVCKLTELEPHVLRYWESQFRSLRPTKNRSGNRVFRRKEIDLIFLIKYLLYEKQFTIEGARLELGRLNERSVPEENPPSNDHYLFGIKKELTELRNILDRPAKQTKD